MNAIVINTGTELLLGHVLNTHLQFIAREIFPLGFRVARHLTVPDGVAIQEALSEAFCSAELVFVTGGLGPTSDDITRDATAELLRLPLQRDATVISAITARLTARGFPITEAVLRQAEVPEGAVVLPNANGTAPGLYLPSAENRPHVFLLPGPPRELHPMFRESVAPILQSIRPAQRLEARTFTLACVGESVVETAIGEQIQSLGEVELGYCARAGEVDIRVLGGRAVLDQAEALIKRAFPDAVFTSSGESLEAAVVRLLTERAQTLATAESCTGGYLAHRVTNVPGSSAVFLAGHITYANEAKQRELNVASSLFEQHGAVSEPVARAMAEGARRKAHADYALATTGIAGPAGGSGEKPVGTVFIALACRTGETIVEKSRFLTDRETFKQMTTQAALEMLRRRIIAPLSPQ